jgi:hypothetical protein
MGNKSNSKKKKATDNNNDTTVSKSVKRFQSVEVEGGFVAFQFHNKWYFKNGNTITHDFPKDDKKATMTKFLQTATGQDQSALMANNKEQLIPMVLEQLDAHASPSLLGHGCRPPRDTNKNQLCNYLITVYPPGTYDKAKLLNETKDTLLGMIGDYLNSKAASSIKPPVIPGAASTKAAVPPAAAGSVTAVSSALPPHPGGVVAALTDHVNAQQQTTTVTATAPAELINHVHTQHQTTTVTATASGRTAAAASSSAESPPAAAGSSPPAAAGVIRHIPPPACHIRTTSLDTEGSDQTTKLYGEEEESHVYPPVPELRLPPNHHLSPPSEKKEMDKVTAVLNWINECLSLGCFPYTGNVTITKKRDKRIDGKRKRKGTLGPDNPSLLGQGYEDDDDDDDDYYDLYSDELRPSYQPLPLSTFQGIYEGPHMCKLFACALLVNETIFFLTPLLYQLYLPVFHAVPSNLDWHGDFFDRYPFTWAAKYYGATRWTCNFEHVRRLRKWIHLIQENPKVLNRSDLHRMTHKNKKIYEFEIRPQSYYVVLRQTSAAIYHSIATGTGPLFLPSVNHDTILHNDEMGPKMKDQTKKMAGLLFKYLGFKKYFIERFVYCDNKRTENDPDGYIRFLNDETRNHPGSAIACKANSLRDNRTYLAKVVFLWAMDLCGSPAWDYRFPKNYHLAARTGKDGKKASIPQKARIEHDDPEINFEDFDGNVEAEADDARSVKLRLHDDPLMQHFHASKELPNSTNEMQMALLASVAATQPEANQDGETGEC